MSEPVETIDLSIYNPSTEGSLEVYGSNSSSLGGLIGNSELEVDKYILQAETKGEDYEEERRHNIDHGSGTLRDSHHITRKTDSTEIDPRVLEEMHPAVKLSGSYNPSTINLEMRDPTLLIPKEARVEEGREIYLRTPEGTGPRGDYFDGDNEIPHVEATIQESDDGVTYEMKTGSGHMSAVARLRGKDREEHLNEVLETINVPNWETIKSEQIRQQI